MKKSGRSIYIGPVTVSVLWAVRLQQNPGTEFTERSIALFVYSAASREAN